MKQTLPPSNASPRRWLLGGALAVLTLVVFAQTTRFDFINYDDNLYVSENPNVQRGLTAETFRWAWTTVESGSWQPLTWLSYLLDASLQGTGPHGFHRTNLVLHLLNVLLLYAVLFSATADAERSAFVAALFAVHPLHVENVAWISERKDLLCALFGFLALGAYLRYVRSGNWKWYAAMIAALLASLLSKQMLVTFPFVLLLLDYWPLGRTRRDNPPGGASWPAIVREKLALFLVVAAFSALVYWTQARAGAVESLDKYSLGTRVANALVSYATYVRRTVWPSDLAVIYPHPGDALSSAQMGAAVAVLLAITLLVASLAFLRPALIVGWLWFLGTLVPVIGLVQIGRQQMSDRYTYIPLVGLFLAVAWGVPWPRHPVSRRLAAALACAAVLVCAVLAAKQTQHWRNDLALFSHAVAVNSNNVEARAKLASALGKDGRLDEAVQQYQAALAVEPDNHYVHQNLGRTYQQLGCNADAIAHFRAAVEHQPDYALGHYSLGLATLAQGQSEAAAGYTEASRHHILEAIGHLQKSAELEPRFAPTHYELGNAALGLSRWSEAAAHFARAAELDPADPRYRHNLGVSLGQLGRHAEAADNYEAAIQLGLRTSMAYLNLAACRERLGQIDQAAGSFEMAVRLDPRNARVHNEYGKFLARHKQNAAARKCFETALQLNPNFAEAKANLQALAPR